MSRASLLTSPALTLRWMIHLDLPRVVDISRNVPGLKWDEEEFLQSLRGVDTVGNVAEVGEEVVGYLIYKLRRGPRDDEAEAEDGPRRLADLMRPAERALRIAVLNMAVAPEWQRHGIGRSMLAKLERKIQCEGGSISLTVPERNLAMQLFLRRAGYRAVRVLRDYFDTEDAYLMERQAAAVVPAVR